jgi:hypothetical protein
VPEVSRFYGIIIALYYNDHAPPHFHAKYGGDEATIHIETGEVLDGHLSKRALRLVEEWRKLYEHELHEDWELARAKYPLNKISPLE